MTGEGQNSIQSVFAATMTATVKADQSTDR